MYFYTGPGGATNDSPINSDDDEETVKVRECVNLFIMRILSQEMMGYYYYIAGEGEE